MPEFLRLFDAVVHAQGGAIAVVARDATLSFSELQGAARRLAGELRAAGVREGDLVALALGRSSLHVVGMLAAWYAGAAFLPVDPSAPEDRLRAMLDESRARALLVDDEGRPSVRILDRAEAPAEVPAEALAYVIYTSGSTGRPKGVRVGHRGLCPMLLEQIRAFRLAAGKRALFVLSTAFDASISDIGTCLLSGATLVMAEALPAPSALPERLRADAITHADLPPSILPLVEPRTLPPSLETVVIGGEVCPPHVVRAWASRVRVVNVYGPTEATICASLCACDAQNWRRPLLGDPLPHVEFALDEGELLIAGPGLALGYVAQPELEARRFVERSGKRWYRTGDLVRQQDDGALEFLGRLDRQIKLHGRLVCPEEIEARLTAIEGVAEVRVEPEPRGGDTPKALRAWVVASDGARLSTAGVSQQLATSLPAWMIPRITLTSALPRGVSGKVAADRIATAIASGPTAPRALALARIVTQVLDVADVGVDDDVVALGADSLGALEIAAVAQLSGIAIEAATVLAQRTPAAMARAEVTQAQRITRLEALGERLAGELAGISPRCWPAQGQGDDWLVSGATGFLGRHLVPALLARTEGRVHCVVRAASDGEARARLGPLAQDPRVVAHAGDVSASRLGLVEPVWQDLAGQVGHVLHAAASLSLALPFEALEATNVRGSLEVARFVRAGQEKTLHYVSSLAVLAASDLPADRLDEETRLTPDVRIVGAYAQTKWVSEALLRRAVSDLQIIRPGLLTAHSRSAESAPGCPLAAFLRAVLRLGCLPVADDERLRVDVTPVDVAAEVIAGALTAPSRPAVVHVASEHGASLSDLIRAMVRWVPVERVTREGFMVRAREGLTRDDALGLMASSYRLLGTDAQRGADLFLHTGRTFASRWLSQSRGPVASWLDDELLGRYAAAAARGDR